MSDTFSLSSSSSLSSEAEPSSRRPHSLKASKSSSCNSSQDFLNQSGTGSAGSGSAEGTPSRETISAAMDRYVSASKDGREAFHNGNLTDAAREFNEALDIELQTELECLYDTSIGLVSGLVRREVASRLELHPSSDTAQERCAKILQQLRDTYEHAAAGTRGKKSSSPEWYLRMGAALIVINEWEKAKAIYSEGVATCKDKKRLKIALKNLIKMEQMTSYGEIPAEDQPDQKDEYPASPKLSPAHSPSQSVRLRSGSMEPATLRQVKQYQRGRTTSLSLEKFSDKSNGHRKTSTSPRPSLALAKRSSSPAISKKEKRLSFSLFNFRRSSNAAGLLSSKPPSVTSPEEIEEWKECFEPTQCRVLGQSSLQPLAITHMRRLSSVGGEEDGAETDLDHIKLNRSYTCNVVQKSMVIDDDDSELEDED